MAARLNLFRSGRLLDQLPERTRQAIREDQAQAEVLIAWVQLAIVTAFALLYGLAPQATMRAEPHLEPLPWVLGAYAAVTSTRLGLAYARALGGALLAASVVVDLVLLMALIWGFHIQYAQPPAFYLKVPTLLTAFIFIALRALRFQVKLPVGPDKLHQIERRQIARGIVQKHVFRARIGGINARRVLRRMPAVDGGVELHARIAALMRRLGDLPHQIAGPVTVLFFSGQPRRRPPLVIADHRFHELVGGAHAVVGVLKENRAVRLAIQRGIVAGLDQGVRLLFFLGLAPDEFFNIGVIRVEDHHLGRPPRLAAAFDHPRERVKALHEAERSRGPAAAGKQALLLAQRRKIGPGAGTPLEQHPFRLHQIQNRFQRIPHRIDEAGRALRPVFALLQPLHHRRGLR